VKILETERTILRKVTESDADFVLDLLNQPSFIKYIADRNVRTLEQSREYIESRFTASYEKFGFGMWAVVSKESGEIMGVCGFVRREGLPEADIGFAFLPQFEGKGYAFEAASAIMRYGRDVLKLPRVLAITSMDNTRSQRLLEKIGLKYERIVSLPGSTEELKLFSTNF
jgi:RimJ/RimL family protein N-acetyltransferase